MPRPNPRTPGFAGPPSTHDVGGCDHPDADFGQGPPATIWTLQVDLDKLHTGDLARVLRSLADRFDDLPPSDDDKSVASGWAHLDGTNVGHFQVDLQPTRL